MSVSPPPSQIETKEIQWRGPHCLALTLDNIAVIDHVEVLFPKGFTVITGEAGSGKSLMVEAFGWLFGDTLSPKEMIRHGESLARIEATFVLPPKNQWPQGLRQWEAQLTVPLQGNFPQLTLTREISLAGGSRYRLTYGPTSVSITRSVVETLRPWILEVQGQWASTQLTKSSIQRDILDGFDGTGQITQLKQRVQHAYGLWAEALKTLKAWTEDRQAAEQQRAFLQFQFDELEAAQLTDAQEDARLEAELQQYLHQEALHDAVLSVVQGLQEGNNALWGGDTPVIDQLARLKKQLDGVLSWDKRLAPLSERLESCLIECQEVATEGSRYVDRLNRDTDQIPILEERLGILNRIKKRYGPTLREAIETFESLDAKLSAMEGEPQSIEALTVKVHKLEAELATACGALTQARMTLAQKFTAALLPLLHRLALPHAGFDVLLDPTDMGPDGAERVEFLFSANPGEPLRPLGKVASGGEMARVLLAISAMAPELGVKFTEGAGELHVQEHLWKRIFVFDEVDAGTSGQTSKAMAELFTTMGYHHHQVLVVTHQPIIAAYGTTHFHVEKKPTESPELTTERVSVSVEAVSQGDRHRALGRLASGLSQGDEAVHGYIARLLEEADRFRLSQVTSPVSL